MYFLRLLFVLYSFIVRSLFVYCSFFIRLLFVITVIAENSIKRRFRYEYDNLSKRD